MAFPDWLAGQLITADELNDRQPITAYKTALESRTSTITLADDSELIVAVRDQFMYTIHAVINYSCAADGVDLRYGWSVPAGSGIWWGNAGLDIGVVGNSGSFNTHFNTLPQGNAARAVGAVDEGPTQLRLDGILDPGADGNLAFQWAQFTTSATALNVRETSFVELTPIRRS